ncbi:hypothetical protein C3L33_13371, partial [Rhododendron williamsianum]
MPTTPSILFFLFLLFVTNLNCTFSLSSDGLSLLSLKSAVDSDGASAFSDWNEDEDTPCRWTGIACANISGVSRVVGVAVSGRNLRGYIPSELGTLVYLRRLNLHGNNLYGSIPDQLFNASALHSLFLYGNNLSGPIPPSLCNPTRLQNLDLSNNSISGPLPDFLRNCAQLQRLILADNKLSGKIPAGIWPAIPNLVQLDLSSNGFTGPIPEYIGELKSLSGTLNLSFNHFSGGIPVSLGDLPMTVSFDLRNNNFSGEIPQTGSFSNQGPTAFLNNPSLCGFPLKKKCQKNSTETVPGIQNSSPESGSNGQKKGLKPGLIILISVADAVGVSFIGLIVIYLYWKKKDSNSCSCAGRGKLGGNEKTKLCVCPCMNGFPSHESEIDSEKGGNGSGGGGSGAGTGGGEGDLVAIDKGFNFELDELLRASAYVLGKSGLGIVYKVVLGNGVPVAVRRLGEGGEQRYKEFVAEIQAITRVKHPNIVRLRAYYWAPDEKLLISDFISNGNLSSALRGKFPYFSVFVFGFDPFPESFGNRESVPPEKANNYRAPEARSSIDRPTQKWDVYSFGVVCLELLTGKSPELSSPTTSTSTEVQDLVRWVRKGFEEENPLSDMVDHMLLQEVHAKKEVLAVFHIALACTEGDPEVRPRMKTVSENLDRIG